jgi:hypothetical protein
MFIKKPTHKKFEYQPRFYKPEEDSSERRKRRLGFKSSYKDSSYSKKNPIMFIIMFLFIIFLLLKWNGIL